MYAIGLPWRAAVPIMSDRVRTPDAVILVFCIHCTMGLPEQNLQNKTKPPNQRSSSMLLWIFLGVIIAAFVAFAVIRPALQTNTGPDRSTPAGPAK